MKEVVDADSSCHMQDILEGALVGGFGEVQELLEEQSRGAGMVQHIVGEVQENQLLEDGCLDMDPAENRWQKFEYAACWVVFCCGNH